VMIRPIYTLRIFFHQAMSPKLEEVEM